MMVVVIAKDNNGDSDCNDSGVVLGEKKNRKLGWGLWLNVERGRERKRYAKMELWVIK